MNGRVPTPKPFESTPFAKSLLREMMQGRGPLFADWHEGLHPSLRSGADAVMAEDRVRPHSHLSARNSSMGLALNLALPFRLGDPGGLGSLLTEVLGCPFRVERVLFEYGGPGDILGELAGDTPEPDEPFTPADIAVFGTSGDGRTGVVLLEVKLTEGGFNPCTGAESRGPCSEPLFGRGHGGETHRGVPAGARARDRTLSTSCA